MIIDTKKVLATAGRVAGAAASMGVTELIRKKKSEKEDFDYEVRMFMMKYPQFDEEQAREIVRNHRNEVKAQVKEAKRELKKIKYDDDMRLYKDEEA